MLCHRDIKMNLWTREVKISQGGCTDTLVVCNADATLLFWFFRTPMNGAYLTNNPSSLLHIILFGGWITYVHICMVAQMVSWIILLAKRSSLINPHGRSYINVRTQSLFTLWWSSRSLWLLWWRSFGSCFYASELSKSILVVRWPRHSWEIFCSQGWMSWLCLELASPKRNYFGDLGLKFCLRYQGWRGCFF